MSQEYFPNFIIKYIKIVVAKSIKKRAKLKQKKHHIIISTGDCFCLLHGCAVLLQIAIELPKLLKTTTSQNLIILIQLYDKNKN